MIIRTVEINNYQSHKKSAFEFVPGVNVIIGPSDAGKSAAFRAINWLLNNRPLGDGFRSEWGGETRVQLATDEDEVVSRVKSKSINAYMIGDPTDKPIVLKAFGSDPPEQVNAILAMDAANLQDQSDPPFLLSDSPGEVAKKLNQAASIDDIDKATSNLKRGHDNTRRDIQSGERWLGEQEQLLEQYTHLDDAERVIEEVEDLERQRGSLYTQYTNLQRIVSNIRSANQKLAQIGDVQTASGLLNDAWKVNKQRDQVQAKHKQLSSLLSRIQTTQTRLNKTEEQLGQLQTKYDELAPEMCPLCGNPMKGE